MMRESSVDLERLGDLWNKYFLEGMGREFHGSGVSLIRALPTVKRVKEGVLPYEDALQLVKNGRPLTLNHCAAASRFATATTRWRSASV